MLTLIWTIPCNFDLGNIPADALKTQQHGTFRTHQLSLTMTYTVQRLIRNIHLRCSILFDLNKYQKIKMINLSQNGNLNSKCDCLDFRQDYDDMMMGGPIPPDILHGSSTCLDSSVH